MASPPRTGWKLDDGWIQGNEIYPIRVFGSGKQFSLQVLLRMNNEDIDPLCGGTSQGFKVVIHPPYASIFHAWKFELTFWLIFLLISTRNEDPQTSKQYFQISPGKQAFFSINPNLLTTSLDTKKFSAGVRQCYFTDERKLRFYRFYSQRNCEAECLTNFTILLCGCVKLSMLSKQFT